MNARLLARDIAARLRDTCGEEADLEAEVLVRHASGMNRTMFFSGAEACPGRVEPMVVRRTAGEPLAYITGSREFFGMEFAVSPAVLVPRPETELLVELALAELESAPGVPLVDVGTGSGCIAVAVAANRIDDGRTLMTDVSATALAVARRNVRAHGVSCHAIRGGLADCVGSAGIVVANLPYVPTAEIELLQPEVRIWEPRQALDGGSDGLRFINALVDDCGARLRPRLVLIEIDPGQAQPVVTRLQAAGAEAIQVHQDLAGTDRVVSGRCA